MWIWDIPKNYMPKGHSQRRITSSETKITNLEIPDEMVMMLRKKK